MFLLNEPINRYYLQSADALVKTIMTDVSSQKTSVEQKATQRDAVIILQLATHFLLALYPAPTEVPFIMGDAMRLISELSDGVGEA